MLVVVVDLEAPTLWREHDVVGDCDEELNVGLVVVGVGEVVGDGICFGYLALHLVDDGRELGE